MKKVPFFILLNINIVSIYASNCVVDCVPYPPPSHSAIVSKPVAQNVVLELGMTNYYRYHPTRNFKKTCAYTEDVNTKMDVESWASKESPPTAVDEDLLGLIATPAQDTQPKADAPVAPPTTMDATDAYAPPIAPQPLSIEKLDPQEETQEICDWNMLRTLNQEIKEIATLNQKVVDEQMVLQLPNLTFDFFPFFFVSTNKESLARYFLPNEASTIVVAENNVSDISSPWVGITTANQSFSSGLTIRPKRKEFGFSFNFFARLHSVCDYDWAKKLWLEAFIPVEWVQHSLNIEQCYNEEGYPFANAISAFNNPSWNFGKLSCKPHSEFGVADILLRIGYDALLNECNHIALYACGFIPTSGSLRSRYLFEPTLGNLGHGGLGGGINADWRVWEKDETTTVNWMTDIRAAYFFKRKETRSADLMVNLDWSRYLEVAKLDDLETPLPGINFFTQQLTVKPRAMVNLWTALHVDHCDCHLELGYNFWWRQKEQVEGFCNPNVVIYDIQGTPGSRTSANSAIISTGAPGAGAPISDLTPQLVKATRFSSDTPAIPALLINTVYASLGKEFTYCDRTSLVSLGLYYDASHHRTGFAGVGGWLKGSVIF